MKMMAAASCDARSSDTQSAKEVAAKLAQMQAERARQDQMWNMPQTKYELSSDNKIVIQSHTKSG